MNRGVTVLIFVVGILLLTSFVSAEKIWNFNNHTVNVSDDLYVGGIIYGNGSEMEVAPYGEGSIYLDGEEIFGGTGVVSSRICIGPLCQAIDENIT